MFFLCYSIFNWYICNTWCLHSVQGWMHTWNILLSFILPVSPPTPLPPSMHPLPISTEFTSLLLSMFFCFSLHDICVLILSYYRTRWPTTFCNWLAPTRRMVSRWITFPQMTQMYPFHDWVVLPRVICHIFLIHISIDEQFPWFSSCELCCQKYENEFINIIWWFWLPLGRYQKE